MNNLDILIILIVLISALIAFNRGLIKEVLSIIGWILGVATVIFLLPYVQPFAEQYIDSEVMAIATTAISILIIFFVLWIYLSAVIIEKVRSSKLSGMDRTLGLFFGILRAFLLIILLNILIGWIIPKDVQPEVFQESKYFQIAGNFAEPIEKLIPQETRDKLSMTSQKDQEVSDGVVYDSDLDDLFEKLTQPQVKKIEVEKPEFEDQKGYDKSEQKSLDRLIEMTSEEG